jgi:hypothetical protein
MNEDNSMRHRFSFVFGAAALATMLSLPATAQEYSNGGKGAKGRGPATSTPVEAYGVHPPGLAPADAKHWKPYVPYYAPLSPVASSTRWRPWANCFLLPYYTPYYQGYSPHRLFNPRPRPYGSNGWGSGPRPEAPLPDEPGTTPLQYDGYTSVVDDDTTFWNMGGNGLVPYGEPQPATARPPDLIDAIQASRPQCHLRRTMIRGAPAIVPPLEAVEGQIEAEPIEGVASESTSHRRPKSNEPRAGEVSLDQSDNAGADHAGEKSAIPAKPSPRGDD